MQFENIEKQNRKKMEDLLTSRKWEFEIRCGYDY